MRPAPSAARPRGSGELPVHVEIDERTGRWSVDGIPMILVPQHLMVNNLAAAETALGARSAAGLVQEPGYRSAQTWCARQRAFHGLDELGVVHHYLDQLGRRGWGRFSIHSLDVAAGEAEVHVEHSALAGADAPPGLTGCYLFCGWLEGALDAARAGLGTAPGFRVEETACAGAGAPVCVFSARVPGGPAPT